jgi:hypothetical protein
MSPAARRETIATAGDNLPNPLIDSSAKLDNVK